MKVFISWSGERSKAAAVALRKWLTSVVHNANPFVSDLDIEKGTVALKEIAKQLQDSNRGIVCLTKENLDSQWINYESGALSKEADSNRIWTFLWDLEVDEVTGPLRQFQHTRAKKADMFKLVSDIHAAAGNEVDEDDLRETFEQKWPKLLEKLDKIPMTKKDPLRNLINRIVRVESVTFSRSKVQPGDTFTLTYNIKSSQDVNGLWLGSSFGTTKPSRLFSSPPDDIAIQVVNGTHEYKRKFKVASDAPTGNHDLRVNVWFGTPGRTDQSTKIYGILKPLVIAK